MGMDTVCWTNKQQIELGHSSVLMFSVRGRRPDFRRLSVSQIFALKNLQRGANSTFDLFHFENERKRQNEGAEMLETI